MKRGESYVWQQSAWPSFRWRAERLLGPLAEARAKQGRLLGRMEQLGFELQREAQARAVVEEALKSSEIEGEQLDAESVRSSVAQRLGLMKGGLRPADPKTNGVVEMLLDATGGFEKPLTQQRLLAWHAALFPTGYSDLHRVRTGDWRNGAAGPMQVVSGPTGRTKVHYEAPPARRLPREMKAFLKWFNQPRTGEGLLRAGLAHLWFVTIHPLDDGNGRVARAIADMALAQLEDAPLRFYSLSRQIRRERKAYYDVLERTQRGGLDVTAWLEWFVGCFARAIDAADEVSGEVFRRAEFWNRHVKAPMTPRQKTVLNRFLGNFEGKLTAKKWAALAKCSVDTAQRDINDLVERKILIKNEGGSKNTSYALKV
ncbi:MAG: Fic family protein [Myxococcaceae bacterium]|nr:Fic family protein [Myxococcaceae bacterium]